jgi:hypothetical protein
MSTAATLNSFYKTVSSAGTFEDIAASTVKFNSMTLTAKKANDTANTGDIMIRFDGQTEEDLLAPGESRTFNATNGGFFTGNQFEIDAATTGDGTLVQTIANIPYDGP